MNKLIVLAGVLLAISAPVGAATIVNVDGRTNTSMDGANAVSVSLDAGTYEVRFVTDAYTAFSRWSGESGCNGDGLHCRSGWENSARIIADSTLYKFGDGDASGGLGPLGGEDGYFGSAATSFAHSAIYSMKFTLAQAGDVKFFIYDDHLTDNRGGVSLSVAAVPEPATWAMLIAGFGLVGMAARRRKSAGARA